MRVYLSTLGSVHSLRAGRYAFKGERVGAAVIGFDYIFIRYLKVLNITLRFVLMKLLIIETVLCVSVFLKMFHVET